MVVHVPQSVRANSIDAAQNSARLLSIVLVLSRTHERILREYKFAELRGILQRIAALGAHSPTLERLAQFFELRK